MSDAVRQDQQFRDLRYAYMTDYDSYVVLVKTSEKQENYDLYMGRKIEDLRFYPTDAVARDDGQTELSVTDHAQNMRFIVPKAPTLAQLTAPNAKPPADVQMFYNNKSDVERVALWDDARRAAELEKTRQTVRLVDTSYEKIVGQAGEKLQVNLVSPPPRLSLLPQRPAKPVV